MKLKNPVKDLDLGKAKTLNQLVKQFSSAGGFSAKKVGAGVDVLEGMMKSNDCTKFLSFPAAIVSTGTRGVIKELVKQKLVDVLITTSGTIDHDFARVFKDYYAGEFELNDLELRKKKINRLGNILIPYANYGKIIEDKMQPILKQIYKIKSEWAPSEVIFELGKSVNGKKAKDSIIYQAAKNKIPIFTPGFESGAFGSQLWLFRQTHPQFKVDVLTDEQKLNQIVQNSKSTGALMIGGGISKHHTIWWNQFKGGLDYAVYITTAPEWDGSLSGARVREGISWGKVSERAKQITIEGEATVLLPLMIAAVLERIKR
ncbi:TPA: deoxyhypusine synthase [archaeon]|uniref:Deoxyhypusine synthase n=1 Tax=Candidatus Naiadarchaeum limnaeum TaxID=2756139 RepID=A0A832XHX9_9ARCH|nr:deoxyhypusine synthase [Candidatus Naiadarchaeales archaeon SRR2090153.bin1042]HIK00006.1 deoxyhypusine synthase [Candidatus Naiadarchaeum limnaeum]